MSRTRWLVAALLAACLLGACNDDDPKPDIPDPTSSAPTSAATASTPPSSQATNATGPVDVVKAWIAAQNHGLETGDTSALRALAADDCRGCDDFPDGIDKIIGAGGSFTGGKWTLVKAKVADAQARPLRINVAVHIAGGTTVTAAGGSPNTYGPSDRLLAFELNEESGSWLISLIGSLS